MRWETTKWSAAAVGARRFLDTIKSLLVGGAGNMEEYWKAWRLRPQETIWHSRAWKP